VPGLLLAKTDPFSPKGAPFRQKRSLFANTDPFSPEAIPFRQYRSFFAKSVPFLAKSGPLSPKGVQLPIEDWEQIQNDLGEPQTLRDKKAFMYDLKDSVEEVKIAKEGKIKLQSAKDFLGEV